MVTASRFGLAEDFSIGYNNLAQYQLRRINLSLLEDGHYYNVQIAVSDNWGGHAVSVAGDNGFQYDDNINTAPQAPETGFSPHDEIIKNIRPVFSWNPGSDSDVNDKLKYIVQISRDSSFSDSRYISRQSRFDVTRIRLQTTLIENTTYYWRVRSVDLEEALSAWSPVNKFTVNQYNESPRDVSCLYSPADLSEITHRATFKWAPVTDPDPGDSVFYILLIDDNSDFGSPEIQFKSPALTHAASFCSRDTLSLNFSEFGTADLLKDNQLYFWKIVAVDRFNIGGATSTALSRFIYNPQNNPPNIVSGKFSPSGGRIINTRTPILSWPASGDPDFLDLEKTISYKIQLSKSPMFLEDSISTLHTAPGETSIPIRSELEENRKYFYRVQAIDPHGAESKWSSISSFITNAIPEAPLVVSEEFSPKDSMIINSNEPIISWLPVHDPDPGQHMRDIYYHIRYFITTKPNKYFYSESEKGVPSIQLYYLKEDKYYGYQVSATGPDGKTSGWSDANYFGVNVYDNPPTNFYPVSPGSYEDSVLTDMVFQWSVSRDNDLGGTVKYTIYYSTDSTFYSNVFEASVDTDDSLLVSYRPNVPLERKTKYFWKIVATDNDGNQTWASNSNKVPFVFTTIGYSKYNDGSLPDAFLLYQNYPNPFNQQTVFKYSVPEIGPVDVVIYDVLGKRIKTLASGKQQPGTYEVIWDGTDAGGSPVPGGMYICRMSARNYHSHKKVLLMK